MPPLDASTIRLDIGQNYTMAQPHASSAMWTAIQDLKTMMARPRSRSETASLSRATTTTSSSSQNFHRGYIIQYRYTEELGFLPYARLASQDLSHPYHEVVTDLPLFTSHPISYIEIAPRGPMQASCSNPPRMIYTDDGGQFSHHDLVFDPEEDVEEIRLLRDRHVVCIYWDDDEQKALIDQYVASSDPGEETLQGTWHRMEKEAWIEGLPILEETSRTMEDEWPEDHYEGYPRDTPGAVRYEWPGEDYKEQSEEESEEDNSVADSAIVMPCTQE